MPRIFRSEACGTVYTVYYDFGGFLTSPQSEPAKRSTTYVRELCPVHTFESARRKSRQASRNPPGDSTQGRTSRDTVRFHTSNEGAVGCCWCPLRRYELFRFGGIAAQSIAYSFEVCNFSPSQGSPSCLALRTGPGSFKVKLFTTTVQRT